MGFDLLLSSKINLLRQNSVFWAQVQTAISWVLSSRQEGKVGTFSFICWSAHLSPHVFRYVYLPSNSHILLSIYAHLLSSFTYVLAAGMPLLVSISHLWDRGRIAPLIDLLWELSEIMSTNKNVYVCKIVIMTTHPLLSLHTTSSAN